MKKIYELKNITKIYNPVYKEIKALDNINLSFNEGEIITILGPSGSGKSTMLNLLSGIDTPTEGSINFENQNISLLNETQLTIYRKENLGFIFQSYNLISNLTVLENIELGTQLSNNSLEIDELLKTVNMYEQKHKFPYQLSGGQMQRVAILRALAKNPKVLFCDEPTGALDENMGKETLKLLQEINKKYNTTIIIVTHNPSISEMSNTVIKMNSGKLSKIITNKTIKNAEEIGWA